MQTFVDAWLYGVAKATGKWVGGIEDVNDQGSLLDELIDNVDIESVLSDESDKQSSAILSKLVKIYEEQNLDAVELMSKEMNDQQRYKMLVRRNIKMAHRMDSLSAIRSVFSR
ncbi:TraB/GumN family protein [Niabella sp. W65]|nr:TraB/GumN family protein [Niabella sp. W65]MCH7362670.1 TraB/GumN family protein [Niabella sp. W65]